MKWLRLLLGTAQILNKEEKIMSALDDLTAEVTKLVASIDAAIAVIGSTSDATQLAALTAQLSTAQSALDAAVAAKLTAPST